MSSKQPKRPRTHIEKVAAIFGNSDPANKTTLLNLNQSTRYFTGFYLNEHRNRLDAEVFAADKGNRSRWSHEGYAERQRGCFGLHLPVEPNFRQSKWRESSTQCRKGRVAQQRPPFEQRNSVWVVSRGKLWR